MAFILFHSYSYYCFGGHNTSCFHPLNPGYLAPNIFQVLEF